MGSKEEGPESQQVTGDSRVEHILKVNFRVGVVQAGSGCLP